jgi:hypothetical protein
MIDAVEEEGVRRARAR